MGKKSIIKNLIEYCYNILKIKENLESYLAGVEHELFLIIDMLTNMNKKDD